MRLAQLLESDIPNTPPNGAEPFQSTSALISTELYGWVEDRATDAAESLFSGLGNILSNPPDEAMMDEILQIFTAKLREELLGV